jgi:hypothetical protein
MPFSRQVFLIISCVLVLTRATPAQSTRGIPTFGNDFYLTATQEFDACPNQNPQRGIWIFVTATADSRIAINYFDAKGKEVNAGTFSVGAKQYKEISLDPSYLRPVEKAGDTAEYRGAHIVSSAPISVAYLAVGPVNDGYTYILPTPALGRTYVVPSMPSSSGLGASDYCAANQRSSFFNIVAAWDSTRITITPNGTTMGGHTGKLYGSGASGTEHPYSVTLQRGQIYLVRADTSTLGNDEGGSTVVASKPVAVIGAHEAALNGLTQAAQYGFEQRNLLVQQALPYEYWATRDYIGVPIIDLPATAENDPNSGEQVRVFSYDSVNRARLIDNSDRDTSSDLTRFGVFTTPHVRDGYMVSSSYGERILPVAIDYRLPTSGGVCSMPTMQQLVPLSEATNQYAFSLGKSYAASSLVAYLTVIALSDSLASIEYWLDGQGPRSITIQHQAGSDFAIPGHSELIGRRYEVHEGSYILRSNSNFIAYVQGFETYGTNFYASFYNESFASPIGFRLHYDSPARPIVTAARSCSGWSLTLRSDSNARIVCATVLNDPFGAYVRRTSDSGYVSTNVSSTPQSWPAAFFDTAITLTLNPIDPKLPATAYVWVVNQAGNDTLLTLHYPGRRIEYSSDSVSFAGVRLGHDTCATVYLRNNPSPGDTLRIVGLSHKDTTFAITTQASLPITLKPGDSAAVSVCFRSHGRNSVDTLRLQTDCETMSLPLHAVSVNGLLFATDCDFGTVYTGQTIIRTVRLSNVGSADLQIQEGHLDQRSQFVLADSSVLPLSLVPGESRSFRVRFQPTTAGKDTTTIHWITDSDTSLKNYSALVGWAQSPPLGWSRAFAIFGTWNNNEDTVTLINFTDNTSGQTAMIRSIEVRGPDSAEYEIVDNELHLEPLQNFELAPGSQVWVTLRFRPDSTNSRAPRYDTLYAYDARGWNPYVVLYGKIGLAAVRSSSADKEITFTDQFATIACHAKEPGWTLRCFDVMGREVRQPQTFERDLDIPVSELTAGLYFLVAERAGIMVTHRFIVSY